MFTESCEKHWTINSHETQLHPPKVHRLRAEIMIYTYTTSSVASSSTDWWERERNDWLIDLGVKSRKQLLTRHPLNHIQGPWGHILLVPSSLVSTVFTLRWGLWAWGRNWAFWKVTWLISRSHKTRHRFPHSQTHSSLFFSSCFSITEEGRVTHSWVFI